MLPLLPSYSFAIKLVPGNGALTLIGTLFHHHTPYTLSPLLLESFVPHLPKPELQHITVSPSKHILFQLSFASEAK